VLAGRATNTRVREKLIGDSFVWSGSRQMDRLPARAVSERQRDETTVEGSGGVEKNRGCSGGPAPFRERVEPGVSSAAGVK